MTPLPAFVSAEAIYPGRAKVTCHHCGASAIVEEHDREVLERRIASVAKLHSGHGDGGGRCDEHCPCHAVRAARAAKRRRAKERKEAQITIEGTQQAVTRGARWDWR